MSSTAIDQLFQITTASSSSRTSHSTDAVGDQFRAHLDHATDVSVDKATEERSESKQVRDRETESDDAKSYQEENTPNEQDKSATNLQSSSNKADASEEARLADQPEDEVTLSVVVDTQVHHVDAEVEDSLGIDAIVDTAQYEGQEQQGGQSPPQLAQELTIPGGLSTETLLVPTLPTAEDDSAEGGDEKSASDTAGNTNSTGQAQPTTDGVPAIATLPRNSQEQTQQQTSHQEPTADPELTDSPSNGANDHSQQTTNSDSKTSASTGDLIVDTDLDLSLHSRQDNSTAAENTQVATPTVSGNDNLANAARSLGTPLATTAPESTGSNVESQATETSSVDRSRFIQRISGAIRSAQLRDGQIQLRLSPPELGTLRIQLTVSEGVVTAHLEADNAAARSMLLDNLPALRERLAEQEIRIEKFDVDVSRDDQQPADHSETAERQAHDDRPQSGEAAERVHADTAEIVSAPTSSPQSAINGLDVRI